MSSIYRHLLLSFTATASYRCLSFFFFSSTEVIVTQPATPMVETSYSTQLLSGIPAENTDFTLAVDRTIDAVVHITNTAKNNRQSYSLWDLFYDSSKNYPRIGMGSGVIVSPDGYLITNNHVIEDADQIEVTTNDNRIFAADLIGMI